MTITRANYFDFDAASASMLKELDRTPFHYWAKHVDKSTPDEDTTALRKGSALHCLTLEPDTFAGRYPIFSGDARTNEAKAEKKSLEAMAHLAGGYVLRDGEIADVAGMSSAIRADPRSARLLESLSHPEYPIAWVDEESGIACKCRLDGLVCAGSVVLELKSIADASDERVSREIFNRGYFLAAAHYDAGVAAHFGKKPEAFAFIFVENSAPYAVNVKTLDASAMLRGREKRRELLALLNECRKSGRWPSYGETIEPIGLPSWA